MLVSSGGLIVTYLSSCPLKDLEKAVARLVIFLQNAFACSVTVSANANSTSSPTPLIKIFWTYILLTFPMAFVFHTR
jgi:hypothetical protein